MDENPDTDLRSASFEELRALAARGELAPTHRNAPKVDLDDSFWRHARATLALSRKASVHLRVDQDVLGWFKRQGRGHLTRMNAVLKAYVDSQVEDAPAGKKVKAKRAAARKRFDRKTKQS